MSDIDASLRARGMRMTAQRRRVIGALERVEHATPDGLAAEVGADGQGELPLSTIYRNLDALEELGLVSHTHLEHRAPTYHLAEHADHLHLVCLGCEAVIEADPAPAEDLAGNLRRQHGFEADVSHLAIHGWCAACSDSATTPTRSAGPR